MSLWLNAHLPVIGGTGETYAGKTTFGLTIAEPHETLVWDMEKSSASYLDVFPGLTRIDLYDTAAEKAPTGYNASYLFQVWLQQVRRLPPKKYKVAMIDPISEIEQGLCDYVWDNPGEFGKTKAQFEKSGGLYWGSVKDFWKRILMELTAKVETFYYTVHLRQVFEGNAPVRGLKEPKGKHTLDEITSLFLWFKRGKNQMVPSAEVDKCRLMCRKNAAISTVLPPVLRKATPDMIRGYIADPADWNNLKPWEKHINVQLNEVDRAALQIAISTAEREAAQAKLALAQTITNQGGQARTVVTSTGEMEVLRAQEAQPGGTVT